MNETFLQILEKNPEILSNPKLIKHYPVLLSKKIIDQTQKIVNEIKDSKQSQVIVEALIVNNKFKNSKMLFNQLKNKILMTEPNWVNESDFLQIENKIFNLNKKIEDIEINENLICMEIDLIRKAEILDYIKNTGSSFIQLNNDFTNKFKYGTTFLKKKVLDKLSFDLFMKYNSNYLQLFSLKKFDKNVKDNVIGNIGENEVIFSYINMNKMDIPKIPRFGSVFDSYTISEHKVKNVYHKNLKVSVPINIENQMIQIETELFMGTIVCEE